MKLGILLNNGELDSVCLNEPSYAPESKHYTYRDLNKITIPTMESVSLDEYLDMLAVDVTYSFYFLVKLTESSADLIGPFVTAHSARVYENDEYRVAMFGTYNSMGFSRGAVNTLLVNLLKKSSASSSHGSGTLPIN